jgi:conjugal transfer ATP-binding protein TraC
VSDIAAYFAQQEDPRETDLAKQLFPFTRSGSYGRWFDGDNNLEFDNRFIVLELDHLKGKKTLQQVVLLQLLARIQAELFLKPDKTPRLIIVDEAWELLAERDQPGQETGMVAQFLEASYRKLRKSGAGAVIVTQSIRDLASSSAGRAIAENAPFRFILAQRPESVDAAAREGLMEMSEYQRHILKTVHTRPGFYSEIMLDTPVGWGVARLIEDRFTQVLFSTRGAEREEVMAEIAAGVSPIQAVENYLKRHDEEVQP